MDRSPPLKILLRSKKSGTPDNEITAAQWKIGYQWFHLRVGDLQMSFRHMKGYQDDSAAMAARITSSQI